jgi:hypothetical protein
MKHLCIHVDDGSSISILCHAAVSNRLAAVLRRLGVPHEEVDGF